MAQLLHELISDTAWNTPAATALRYADNSMDYAALAAGVEATAQALLALGLERLDRVAVFLEKREEAVLAMFGAAAAGCVFVPVNPLLKPDQVAHILRDSGARLLVTSAARLSGLDLVLAGCPALRSVLVAGERAPAMAGLALKRWSDCVGAAAGLPAHRVIESDVAALLYISGGSGMPKGVVLSHRNLVAGAESMARYLGTNRHDRILAALPFCSDDGLAQLTTAFASGAAVVLMNQLLVRDIPEMVERERISGLAAVPALWTQLAALDWRGRHPLRYLTSCGGTLPRETVAALRAQMPRTALHLMHGMTEGLRATALAPEQLAARPDSIGKALPNTEVMVLAPDGRPCAVNEPGELVQRGPTVSLGYWNDKERSAAHFRPVRGCPGLANGETAWWSGDLARVDEDGYVYLIGRRDDLIQTGGYRVSPSEIEEVVSATGLVSEVAVFGVPHPVLGQAVALVALAQPGCELDVSVLLAACRAKLPVYMLPVHAELRTEALARHADGRLDRRLVARAISGQFAEAAP